jgi:sulfite reductase alpha subunit-like flavoprotein
VALARRGRACLRLRGRHAHGQGCVEAALVDIVAAHGARSPDEAVAFIQGLKRAERYQADVY